MFDENNSWLRCGIQKKTKVCPYGLTEVIAIARTWKTRAETGSMRVRNEREEWILKMWRVKLLGDAFNTWGRKKEGIHIDSEFSSLGK